MSGEGVAAPIENLGAEAMLAASGEKLNAIEGDLDRASDLVAKFQADRDRLINGLAALGLAPEGGWDGAVVSDVVIDIAGTGLKALGGANDRIAVLENAASSHAKDLATVSQQRDALTSEVTELRARLAKTGDPGKPKVIQAPKSQKLRDAGPMENPRPEQLLPQLAERPHVLVFSDGEREIVALDAVQISGAAAWMRRGGAVLLREPVRVKPNVPVELAGFALFNAKGKQVAWCALAQPLRIGAGQEVKLDNQALFG